MQVSMDRYRAVEGDLTAAGGLRSAIGAPGVLSSVTFAPSDAAGSLDIRNKKGNAQPLERQVWGCTVLISQCPLTSIHGNMLGRASSIITECCHPGLILLLFNLLPF